MKLRSTSLTFEEYETLSELPEDNQDLIIKAIEIAKKSYSPYSNFPVGAAILLDDGQIFMGNNQENLSFPAGTCAERSVLHYVNANLPERKVVAIAVTATNSTSANPVTPCGICRQVITEIETKQASNIKVFLHKIDGVTFVFDKAKTLLPLAFEETTLVKKSF